MNFKDFMVQDHRDCDSHFSELESYVEKGDFVAANECFSAFKKEMETHFGIEEEIIFPEFNKKSASGCNPTGVMIMEHDHMRRMFAGMEQGIEKKDKNAFLGHCDTFMMILQQHNLKEEQIMYNLALDALSSTQEEVLRNIVQYKQERSK